MKRIHIILIALLSCSALISCSDFGDLNEDPNRIKTTTPESFLSSALHRVTWIQMQYGHRLGAEFVQHTVQSNEINDFHRYVIPSSESNSIWSRHYTALTDIDDMHRQAEAREADNYLAVAKILKAWTFASLTDIFGPIPYSEALQGDEGALQPAFDSQEEVYLDLLADLELANSLIDLEGSIDAAGDILYQGDLMKWKKFANSLRLRLLLRASGQVNSAPADIAEIYNNPDQYPVFETMDEAAIMNFTGERPNINPFSDWRDFEFNGNRGFSVFFIETLENFNDPRLEKIATPNDDGEYIGIISGREDAAPQGYTSYNLALKDSQMPGIILSHAEIEFIWAEAAQKGWIPSANAEAHYEQGIANSMEFWDAELPAGYLTQAGVAYDGQLETIMLQKWIALFWSGLEGWHEYRRTGLPELTPGPAANNNGIVPTRLLYPSTLQTLNGANYNDAVQSLGGTDDLQAKLWWQE